ncbi:unnamed protein product [Rotaria sordida]|uniref:Rap-GAP domain-containing protein n=1 Tax=Rotaria sordida TaxID=392033 RepID=A0A818UVB2_9BILA|nr:unnamed protein product [Rotaria sordida]CAF0895795.1 unnamed protein product [Rotaria sordida]CAF0910905.1 unnamed protein product [Rotaria sordida]CAF0915177.1 unnamed protein product [Rotaria sordida]CAF0917109.1 unnamed protein product [Rotaria sordida]
MTWCAKIYDIFNGWNDDDDDEHNLPSTPAAKSINGLPESSITSKVTRLSSINDSPYLERSQSILSINNPSNYNKQNHDRYFSSYGGRDDNYHRQEQTSYGIATISNMSLNLPSYSKYIESQNEHSQEQQLSRSYSFELQRNNFLLPSPDINYPTLQQMNRQRNNFDKSLRSSSINALVNTAMIGSQVSLSNRKESLDPRLSTRFSYSVPEYETNDLSCRNNEEVAQAIQYHIKQMLTSAPNSIFSMIYRFPSNEMLNYKDPYRIEGGYDEPSQWIIQTKIAPVECRIISDNVASIYSNYFYDQYHYNLFAIDDNFNPIIMSIKPHDNCLTIIVRTKESSKCLDLIENDSNPIDYVYLARQLYPDLQVDHFENCTNFKAQQFIKAYDEKLETHKFKFGVIYQRRGQTTEEEFFNNERHGRSLDEFLDIIATRVSLKNFKGYRAGLDVSEQTDCPISYYELYDQKEIMFHVSTLLPFTHTDTTQIQRKRHIGNDIVTIVFQEENTPFHPSMIKSNFLHAFLVVQPVQVLSRTCYKMALVTRDDIEIFPPILQRNVVYVRGAEQLKPFILSKLINAEYAAYRCRTFSLLQERTRCSYLKTLCENLTEKSYDLLCDEQKRASHQRLPLLSNPTKKRYFSNMKKMFTRSNSTPDGPQQSSKSEQPMSDKERRKNGKKLIRLGKLDSVDSHQRSSLSMSLPDQEFTHDNDVINRHINVRSDESLDSSGDIPTSEQRSTIHHYPTRSIHAYFGDESDEGLDSMSSADTAFSHNHNRVPYDSDDQDAYRQQLREKSQPSHVSHPWHRITGQRQANIQIYTPQVAGIHISEAATV